MTDAVDEYYNDLEAGIALHHAMPIPESMPKPTYADLVFETYEEFSARIEKACQRTPTLPQKAAGDRLTLDSLIRMGRQEVYERFSTERIDADSPHEANNGVFPAGSRAYIWTNEGLHNLDDYFHLDLAGRDMLIVSASGDPFATFACLGARHQVGFDTSHRGTLWSELKLAAIDKLGYHDFRAFAGLDGEDAAREKALAQQLLPGLSPYASSVFSELFERNGTLRGLFNNGSSSFFRGSGCTSAYPNSNLFTTSEENYERARENLRKHKQVLIPGALEALAGTGVKFGGFYASNIMDHFRGPDGERLETEEPYRDFLTMVDSFMHPDALMIIQFEWSETVKAHAKKVLGELGYACESVPDDHSTNGYGKLCVARRENGKN
jgi:hypothetical protein